MSGFFGGSGFGAGAGSGAGAGCGAGAGSGFLSGSVAAASAGVSFGMTSTRPVPSCSSLRMSAGSQSLVATGSMIRESFFRPSVSEFPISVPSGISLCSLSSLRATSSSTSSSFPCFKLSSSSRSSGPVSCFSFRRTSSVCFWAVSCRICSHSAITWLKSICPVI